MVVDGVDLVRSGQQRQSPQFPRAIAHGRPASIGLIGALEVHEVLVDGRGMLLILREPETGDLLRVRQDGAADHLLHHRQHLGPVPCPMKRLEPVHLVIHRCILEVAFGAPLRGVRDPVHQIGALFEPSSLPADAENIPPQCPEFVGILQRAKEEIPLGVDPPLEFFGSIDRVV